MLNVPLLVGTLIALVVFSPAAYFWHAFQVRRTADAFLVRADQLEAEGDWRAAAAYLDRYLNLGRDDVNVRVRLAEAWDKSAEDSPSLRGKLRVKAQAVYLYYLALGHGHGKIDSKTSHRLRRRLAELQLELGSVPWVERRYAYYMSAQTEAKRLPDDDPQGWRLLALALYGQLLSGTSEGAGQTEGSGGGAVAKESKFEKGTIGFAFEQEEGSNVERAFRRALRLNGADVEVADTLARIYRDHPVLMSGETRDRLTKEKKTPAKEADDVINAMVTYKDEGRNNQENPDALLAAYAYRMRYAEEDLEAVSDEAQRSALQEELKAALEKDLKSALEHGADHLAVLLVAAARARQEARQVQRNGGPAEKANELYQQALGHYQHAIEIAPSDERAYLGLGRVYKVFPGVADNVELAVQTWQAGVQKANAESIPLNSLLAEALVARGRLAEAEKHLDLLDQVLAKRGPALPQAWKMALARSNHLLRGKWLVASREYLKAIPLLERVAEGPRGSTAGSPQSLQAWWQSLQAWRLLGHSYAALNQWNEAALAFQRTASLQQQSGPLQAASLGTYLAAALAWEKSGRPEKAVDDYQRALAIKPTAETWFSLARAHLRCQTKAPKGQPRQWEPFAKAVAEARNPETKEPLKDAWRLTWLEADYAVLSAEERGELAQGMQEATQLLRKAEDEYPDSKGLLERVVLAYERLGSPSDADRALEKYSELVGASLNAYRLRARLCSRRKQHEAARQALHAGFKTLPTAEHPGLEYALAEVSLQAGDTEQARKHLAKLHELLPTKVGLVQQLAELALEAGKLQELEQKWEKKLRELEGPDGVYPLYIEARRLLAQAKGPEDPGFVRASELALQLQSQRPTWPAVYLLSGRVLQGQGKLPEAVEAYGKAIQLGEQRISVYERVIRLLYQLQRFDEAEKYLGQLQDVVPSSEHLSSLEISVAASKGELPRALKLAEKGVQDRPDDPVAQIWLGHILLANEEKERAEAAFQKAVELAPEDLRTLDGLFGFYARTEQSDRAEKALQGLAKSERLTETQRALVLARGYELLGDREKAASSYQEAARLAPDDVAVQMRVAAHLMQTDADEAKKVLRHVVQLAPQSGEAQRRLALVLASSEDEKDWQEAQRLLERSGATQLESSLHQRLQARLLVRRGGSANRKKARQILAKLIADSKDPVDADRLLLARLYETEGRLQAAREQCVSLVSRASPDPTCLAFYVELLLRHGLQNEAARWLSKLEERAPEDWRTVSLRARWLHRQGETAKIETVVEPLATKLLEDCKEDKRQAAQLSLTVGNVYSSVQQHQAAERWYRRLSELLPERYELLAICLARQGRMSEALPMCMEVAKSDDSPGPAIALASVLTSGRPSTEEFQLAEPLLAKAAEEHKDNGALLLSVANVRIVQERMDEAVQLYRRALSVQPKNVLAMNNLATLLSEQPGKQKEALQYIERAIEMSEPQAALLDTKGMILVHDGKPAQAVPCLETAASMPNADPRFHFHLALAYHRVGEIDKARRALETAHAGDLANQILTQIDQRLLAELEQKLGQ